MSRVNIFIVVTFSVVAMSGVAVLAAASSLGAASWLFADLPGAANDIAPQVYLGLVGVLFIALSAAFTLLRALWPRGAARSVSTAQLIISVSCSLLAGLLAVLGSGRYTATALARTLDPVLDESALLNLPSSDGLAMLVVALALALISVVLCLPLARA